MLVEAAGDSAARIEPLREMVRSLHPNLPVYNVRTMEAYYQARLDRPVLPGARNGQRDGGRDSRNRVDRTLRQPADHF